MLKRFHHFPRLVLNTAKAFTTDTAYRIPPKVRDTDLVFAFVNSLTALSAELEGRHYGGGVLGFGPIVRNREGADTVVRRPLWRLRGFWIKPSGKGRPRVVVGTAGLAAAAQPLGMKNRKCEPDPLRTAATRDRRRQPAPKWRRRRIRRLSNF